jgi:hypothetical protein
VKTEPARFEDGEAIYVPTDEMTVMQPGAVATQWTYLGDGEWWATTLEGTSYPRVLRSRLASELPIRTVPADGTLCFMDSTGTFQQRRTTGRTIT